MRVSIISPGVYTYGSLVLGGILKAAGHEVVMSRELEAGGQVTLLSLFSTLQLMDQRIREFVTHQGQVYVGGPVSMCPEMVLGELKPGAVVMGEGEKIVCRLVEEGPEGLPGLAYLQDGLVIKSEPESLISLDHPLPFIPSDLHLQNVRGANIYLETHRGCLGGCTFCQVPRFFGRNIRSRSLENIIAEVKVLKAAGVRRIAVSGGTGNLFGYGEKLNREAFIDLLKAISGIVGQKNLSVPDMRVDLVDEEMLQAVKDYTIGWVFFGIESGSERILKLMRKGVSSSQSLRAVEMARELGVKVGGSFIVGYPGETTEDIELTKEFMEAASLDDVFLSIAEPIPGTPLATLALATPRDEMPLYQPHEGEMRAMKLTEAEARCFDLMIQGETCKPLPRALSTELYNSYLTEARNQRRDIARVMDLLEKYREFAG